MVTQAFADARSFQWLYLPALVDLDRVNDCMFLESRIPDDELDRYLS